MISLKYYVQKILRLFSETSGSELVEFQCNICSKKNFSKIEFLSREIASCRACGSTVRMRSIIHALSIALFNESLVLKDFPVRKDLKGIGMSDWTIYANLLEEKLSYTNTFYHKEPRLDIQNPEKEMLGTLDFIISSDVFEHVLCPISNAFSKASDILNKHGVLIFTAPYSKEGEQTVEHFGELHDFKLEKDNGEFILKDTLESGEIVEYRNLVFHGGPGSTLEMRVFSEKSLLNEFSIAGFKNVKILKEPYLRFGIVHPQDWSLPMIVKK